MDEDYYALVDRKQTGFFKHTVIYLSTDMDRDKLLFLGNAIASAGGKITLEFGSIIHYWITDTGLTSRYFYSFADLFNMLTL